MPQLLSIFIAKLLSTKRRLEALMIKFRARNIHVLNYGNSRIIEGYDLVLRTNVHKTALLSYLVDPIEHYIKGRRTVRFSNDGIAIEMANCLNNLGYVVDVINWDDNSIKLDKVYDHIVFHGAKNYDHISRFANKSGIKIHLIAGSYWRFSNDEEQKRLKDFQRRNNYKLKPDRFVDANEDIVNRSSDIRLAIGNKNINTTYPKDMRVLPINNAAFFDVHYLRSKKDFQYTRNNFYFFAGAGNIHKGLDRLIEVFAGLKNQHLYISAPVESWVKEVYSKQLALENIHLIGQVEMRSSKFYEICNSCAFCILPSCSEGQPGSVLECMMQGLIPIVSSASNLDVLDSHFELKSCSLVEIKRTIEYASALPESKVAFLSKLSYKEARRCYSEKVFSKNLNSILQTELKKIDEDRNNM